MQTRSTIFTGLIRNLKTALEIVPWTECTRPRFKKKKHQTSMDNGGVAPKTAI
jgi:hypothetical protein